MWASRGKTNDTRKTIIGSTTGEAVGTHLVLKQRTLQSKFASRFIIALVALPALVGCRAKDIVTADRLKNGLVVVLPGIEGRSRLNASLVRGLKQGGVPSAIEIYDWGTGSPVGFIVHLTALERNRREAQRIAKRILSYQSTFPGRPVHLIGHSGGGGITLLTLEYLPRETSISSAILLAGAVSPDYDLRRALDRTDFGLWNFYSERDIAFLTLGTTIFGSVDRSHGRAAGAVGFKEPSSLTRDERKIYAEKLHDVPYSSRMKRSGNRGTHTGWVQERFVAQWLAPILNEQIAAAPQQRIHLSKARPVGKKPEQAQRPQIVTPTDIP
jgi:pimeloyl-ACP methyl ester carboxylesterase